MNTLKYKGYIGSVAYSEPDKVAVIMKNVGREGYQYYDERSYLPFGFDHEKKLMINIFTNTDYGPDSTTYRLSLDAAPDFVKKDLGL